MTAAEKQRRYRERQKGGDDLVRTFLIGTIADANKAVEAGHAPAWLLARSASAIEVLEGIGEVEEERPRLLLELVTISYGARTNEEKAAVLRVHEREFETWLRTHYPSLGGKIAKTGAILAHNQRILEWANTERTQGRSTAASLTQGLNACKRLVRARQVRGTASQFAEFTAPAQRKALDLITSGQAAL